MTAALEGGDVSSTPRPHLTPWKNPVPNLQEAGWAPGPIWTGRISRPHWDSIPDHPACSQLPYRLSCPALKKYTVYIWHIVNWASVWYSTSECRSCPTAVCDYVCHRILSIAPTLTFWHDVKDILDMWTDWQTWFLYIPYILISTERSKTCVMVSTDQPVSTSNSFPSNMICCLT